MKKITLILVFLFTVGGIFAQQQVNFVNSSGHDIYISYIVTTDNRDMTGDNHPQLMSAGRGVIVSAGTIYTALENSSISPFKFPYNSFAGINYWYVSGQAAPITSLQAYTIHGEDQKFYFAKVAVSDSSLPIADGGNIGQNFGASQSYIGGTYVSFYFSEIRPDPAEPSRVIYNILAL